MHANNQVHLDLIHQQCMKKQKHNKQSIMVSETLVYVKLSIDIHRDFALIVSSYETTSCNERITL